MILSWQGCLFIRRIAFSEKNAPYRDESGKALGFALLMLISLRTPCKTPRCHMALIPGYSIWLEWHGSRVPLGYTWPVLKSRVLVNIPQARSAKCQAATGFVAVILRPKKYQNRFGVYLGQRMLYKVTDVGQ